MLLRFGRATSSTRPRRRRSGGSGSFYGAAGRPRLIKRKSSAEAEVAAARRQSKLSPPPYVVGQPPTTASCGSSDDNDDEASLAELGIKLLPEFPPDTAGRIWVGFVRNAKACIGHYNSTHQASFVYKHDLDTDGSILVGEQDGIQYYHLNFLAKDKEKGHSQIFFGEVRACVAPKEEDVSCCCPVSPSDAGGKSIRTIEAALKFKFPTWGTAGMDQEYCYACPSRVKHPKGTAYMGDHYADSRQYYMF